MAKTCDNDPRLLGFARKMRHQPADAERRMWRILRGRRFAGFKFRRQYPIAGYILDFYCVAAKVAVKLDGSQHSDPSQRAYDDRRTAELALLGIQVLRFWDHDVLRDTRAVEDTLYSALSQRQPSPQPSPGVPGEGAEPHAASRLPSQAFGRQ